MFIPALVYKELMENSSHYDFEELIALFHMDDHLWIKPPQSEREKGGSENGCNGEGEGDSDEKGNGNGKGNGEGEENENSGGGNNNPSGEFGEDDTKPNGSQSQQDKQQEWEDVARQVAADMQNFHQQGTGSGDIAQEIDFLTQDKMDYEEFLRTFSVTEEVMKVNQDEFDYMYYTYGLNGLPNAEGKKAVDKKVLLIEPLEYKEDKVIKDFVIAIDTSGSCDGETVRRFLEETYSILSEKENFFHKMKVYLIQCDCCIQDVKVIHSEEEWKEYSKDITIQGRGGTDFRPVFRYVKEQQEKKEIRRLKALIYFTDGDGIYPGSKPDYETAFVFLHKTEKMELVPPWAIRLVAEQEGVRHNI